MEKRQGLNRVSVAGVKLQSAEQAVAATCHNGSHLDTDDQIFARCRSMIDRNPLDLGPKIARTQPFADVPFWP